MISCWVHNLDFFILKPLNITSVDLFVLDF